MKNENNALENELLYVGGARLSPPDERDYRVKSNIDGKFPHGKELILWKPKTEMDQGRTSNCVAQAIALWYATYYFRKAYINEIIKNENISEEEFAKGYCERLGSVGAVYGNRRFANGDVEPGMITRQALKAMQKMGDCPSDVWDTNCEVKSVIDMFEYHYDSFKDKLEPIAEYVSVRNKDEAMYLMDKYNLPLIGVIKTNKITPSGSGRHAVSLYAYKDVADGIFTINNSWGKEFDNIQFSFNDFEEVWGMIPYDLIEFNDLDKEHFAYDSIISCVENGLFKGYPDGSFKPEKPVSRGELAVILERLGKI